MDFIVIPSPGQIEGEPDEVVARVNQDLAAVAVGVAEHVSQAFIQHRACGVGHADSLEAWEETPHGEAATEVRMRATALVASIRKLVAQDPSAAGQNSPND